MQKKTFLHNRKSFLKPAKPFNIKQRYRAGFNSQAITVKQFFTMNPEINFMNSGKLFLRLLIPVKCK